MDLSDRRVGWDVFKSGGGVLKFRVDVHSTKKKEQLISRVP